MSPTPIEIDGKQGMVVYLDDQWKPTDKNKAILAKVLFDDGKVAFYTTKVVK